MIIEVIVLAVAFLTSAFAVYYGIRLRINLKREKAVSIMKVYCFSTSFDLSVHKFALLKKPYHNVKEKEDLIFRYTELVDH